MNEKNIPSYQGISFQVPGYPDSQRIDQSLEKIMKKTREISERTGKTKEDIYEEIDFDPEIFVDDYSRNFGYFEDLLSPEEASDYLTSRLDELVSDTKEESKLKKYGEKLKKFLGGKGFAFLATGALLGTTLLSGCIGDAVAPSLPEHDGEVEITNSPDEIITVDDEPGQNNLTGKPDLVVNSVPFPFFLPQPGIGDEPFFVCNIKNIGDAESEPTKFNFEIKSLYACRLCPGCLPIPLPPLTKVRERRELEIEPLSPGEGTTVYSHRYFYDIGLFLSKATIDLENNVDESNEFNNVDRDIYAADGGLALGGYF